MLVNRFLIIRVFKWKLVEWRESCWTSAFVKRKLVKYSFKWQHGIWFQAFVDDESVCSLAIPYLVFLLEEFIDFDGF